MTSRISFLFSFAEYRPTRWSDEGEENNPSKPWRRRIYHKRYSASEEFRLIPTSLQVGALSALFLFVVFFIFPHQAAAQWYEVPGGGATLDTPAAVMDGSVLRLFVRGTDDKIYTNGKQNNVWSGWTEIPGGGRTLSAPLAVYFDNLVYLFVRGADNAIYYNRKLNNSGINGTWEGWKATPNGGRTSSRLTGVVETGRGVPLLHLYIRGTDGIVYQSTMIPSQQFSSWDQLAPNGILSAPEAVVDSANSIYVFVRWTDDRIFMNKRTSGVWGGFNEVSGGGLTKGGPGAVIIEDIIYLYTVGRTDNAVYVNTGGSRGSAWSGWQKLAGDGQTPAGPEAVLENGNKQLFVVGTDRRIYANDNPQPVSATQPFNFSLSSSGTISVQRGSSVVGNIIVTLDPGSTGQSISFSVPNRFPRSGISISGPIPCTPAPTCTVGLAVFAESFTTPTPSGTSETVRVVATGGGVTKTIDIPFVVTARPTFNFSLTSSGTATAVQGSSASVTLTVTLEPGSERQTVSFSTPLGLPRSDLSVVFDPTTCIPAPTCTTTVRINTATSTPPTGGGVYLIRVMAQGGGVAKTTDVPLTVTAGTVSSVISTCGEIKSSGNYILDRDLMSNKTTCLQVHDTSNVSINCNNHVISMDLGGQATNDPIVSIGNVNGFSLNACTLKTVNNSLNWPTKILHIVDSTNGTLETNRFGDSAVTSSDFIDIERSSSLQTFHNTFLNVLYQQKYSSGNKIEDNIFTPPYRSRDAGAGLVISSFGSNNSIKRNQIDGKSNGVFDSISGFIGFDDGIVIEDEANDIIEGNITQNFYDCGIETTGFIQNTRIIGNRVKNAGVCGIGGWYWNSWKGNTVSQNIVEGTPTLFYNFRARGLRPNDRYIYFQDNIFSDNTLVSADQFITADSAVVNMNPSRINLAVGSERAPRPEDYILGNNIFSRNDFGTEKTAPYLFPPSMIIDGGGNKCGLISSDRQPYPLVCSSQVSQVQQQSSVSLLPPPPPPPPPPIDLCIGATGRLADICEQLAQLRALVDSLQRSTAAVPPPESIQSATFQISDRVETAVNLNIRSTPSTSGARIGTATQGNKGAVVAAPSGFNNPASANGFNWWYVDWDNPSLSTGWSVEGTSEADFLTKVILATAPSPQSQQVPPPPVQQQQQVSPQPSSQDFLRLTNAAATQITQNSVVIVWTTDKPATSVITYGTVPNYGSFTPEDTRLATNHSQAIIGLTPDTLYYYKAMSKDASNLTAYAESFFRTLAATVTTSSQTQTQTQTPPPPAGAVPPSSSVTPPPPPPPPPPPATVSSASVLHFALSNGGSKSVTQGLSVENSVVATLISAPSLPQNVSLLISGLPAGASASFSSTNCLMTCSDTLTISTSASTPTGSFTITVTGSVGAVSTTTTFSLTVNNSALIPPPPPPPPPSTAAFDFSLSNAGNLSITKGYSATNTITTTLLSGTAQAVVHSMSISADSGVAYSISSCVPTCSVTLNLTASDSPYSFTGTYPVTVTGTAGGVTKTTTFNLTVNSSVSTPPPPPPPPSQSSTSCGTPQTGGYLTVLCPNGGEVMAAGSTYTIRWRSENSAAVGNTSITLAEIESNGSQRNALTITSSATTNSSGENTYNWTIPNSIPEAIPGYTQTADNYRIMVHMGFTSALSAFPSDRSDANFKITGLVASSERENKFAGILSAMQRALSSISSLLNSPL